MFEPAGPEETSPLWDENHSCGFFPEVVQHLKLFSTTFGDDIFKDDFATFQANVGWVV